MAIGNPLLATWDADGVIRTYEYSNGTFVLIGTKGAFPHAVQPAALTAGADPYPYMKWDWDDTILVLLHSSVSNNWQAKTFSPLLAQFDAISIFTTATNLNGGHCDSVLAAHEHWIKSSALANRGSVKVSSGGGLSIGNTSSANTNGFDTAGFAISPDGLQFLTTPINSQTRNPAWHRRTSLANTSLAYVGTPPFTSNSQNVTWAYNNRSVIVLDTTFNIGKVWVLDGAIWNLLQDISLPAGQVKKAVMSPDTRTLAISTLDGSTWRTRIYNRIGDYFITKQDITGIGELLSFTEDGVLLVDCAQRRAFIRSGELFVSHDSAMVNIPTLIKSQTLSRGLVYPYGQASLYDIAVSSLATNTVDLYNVKLTLLKNTATFDKKDITISEVLGTHEVNTGKWPAGGLPLTNVTGLENPPFYDFTADTLRRLVLETNLFARYGVIYDATSGIPLIWMDFMNDRSVVRNRELVIDFRDGAFLRYSK
ncbi:hypothetical protein [Sinorhizobium meliloti]|uniref:hypothetical protein n=1 Tax=Rhizobium meliloti TaxID=382 RepID=UPI0012978521|nr:hypothetical protein [Sinorhizobium meliloti]MDW9491678.1 hypothetical protein [Sinorhizobium meliloti]MQV02944.1 hypothetical protein [Sinorhizobium meliloti]